MAEELEREAADAEFIAKAFGGPGSQIRACAGANGQPCPQKKSVARSERCPDCTLAHGRTRATARMAKVTDAGLLKRIADSAPPASTIDGQLRRRKDDAIREAGGDPEDEIFDEPDADLAELDAELHQAEPTPAPAKKRGRPFSFKPGTRQPTPAAPKIGDAPRNWWETAKPGEMTKTAEQEQARMSSHKVAKRVPGFIND